MEIKKLITEITNLSSGRETATEYQNLIYESLVYILNGEKRLEKEKEIDNGNQRIDIFYSNHQKGTYFYEELMKIHKYKLPYVVFEVKNYTLQSGNEVINQVCGYLTDKIGQVGVVIANGYSNKNRILEKSRKALNNQKKVIFCIDNKDICYLLKCVIDKDNDKINDFFRKKYNEIAL